MRTPASLIIATLFTLVASEAFGARVRVDPERSALYTGQTLTLRYTLSDTDEAPPAPLLEIPGALVRFAGISQSSSTRVFNNVRTMTTEFTYSYNIKPTEARSYTVRPLIFQLRDGSQIRSNAAEFVATPAPDSPDFRLLIEPDADQAFVGQTIRVRWRWYTAKRIAGAEITWPAPEGAAVTAAPQSDPATALNLPVASLLGTNAALERERQSLDDRVWEVYSAELYVTPTRPGTLVIPAATVLVDVDTGRRRRGVSVFDTQPIVETISSAAEAISIEVRPLPEEGRPDGFTGLVGRYTVETAASPTAVRVGDPIDLTIALRGPVTSTSPPKLDLASDPAYAGRFRVDGDEQPARSSAQGPLLYQRTLRAQRDDITAIPAIEIPYFDPDSGRYAIARSAPIPLEVAPTRVVTLADAQGNLNTDAPGGAIESRAGGLAANIVTPAALRSERFDLIGLATRPVAVALLAGPPALFIVAGGVALARSRRREGNAERLRRLALPEARAGLRNAERADDVAAALRGYLTATGHGTDAMSPEDVRRALVSTAPGVAEDAASLLRACDAARFGAADTDLPALVSAAGGVVTRLDREARR